MTLDSASDPRLALYADLRDVQMRQSLEAAHGLFIAEGEKVIIRALEHGLGPVSFVMAPKWFFRLQPLIEATQADCFLLPEAEIEKLAGFHVHRGALAVFARPNQPPVGDLLAASRRVLVLEDLADHTNIGAIFRTAAALDWDAVLLSPRCADPWYRRSVKVSMGTVFSIPFARIDDWYSFPQMLHDAGFRSLAMTLSAESIPLQGVKVTREENIALVVGSEGQGLSARWETLATAQVNIPMATNIDSLNVAASVAIACWQLRNA